MRKNEKIMSDAGGRPPGVLVWGRGGGYLGQSSRNEMSVCYEARNKELKLLEYDYL